MSIKSIMKKMIPKSIIIWDKPLEDFLSNKSEILPKYFTFFTFKLQIFTKRY